MLEHTCEERMFEMLSHSTWQWYSQCCKIFSDSQPSWTERYAAKLQDAGLVQTNPNEHAYETHAYLPKYFAVKLSMYTLIPTVYRAFAEECSFGN